ARVARHREHLCVCVLELRQVVADGAELTLAHAGERERIEDQHDVPLPTERRQCDVVSVLILACEVGRLVADRERHVAPWSIGLCLLPRRYPPDPSTKYGARTPRMRDAPGPGRDSGPLPPGPGSSAKLRGISRAGVECSARRVSRSSRRFRAPTCSPWAIAASGPCRRRVRRSSRAASA